MEEKYTIYILLTYSGSVLSRVINRRTREPYSHVSIAFDEGLQELYSFGRLHPRNPIYAGFVKEDIANGTYARFPKTTCAIYSLEITKQQYKRLMKELTKFIFSERRYRYNLIGLMGAAVNYPIERQYNYFCSQFVTSLLNNSGIRLIDKEAGLTAPRDFRECHELNLIYEGNLQSYNSIKRYSYSY